MQQSPAVWHHMDVSCKLRFLGAALALSSSVIAGVVPAVPMIAVGQDVESEPLKVVFATPAPEAPAVAPTTPIRFGFKTDDSTPPASPSTTLTEVDAGTHSPIVAVTTPGANIAATSDAAATPATFAVSFTAPTYEPSPKSQEVRTAKTSSYTPPLWVRELLAACLVLEAASQGEFGMRAVMAVIRNRANGNARAFARTVLEPKQFSAFNNVTDGRESMASAVRRAKRDRVWRTALAIVQDAFHDTWHDPTGGATHYTRSAEHTHWTRRLAKTTTIGAHSFYR